MSRPPHPLAFFSLRLHRGNERAKRAVAHTDNFHHVSTLSNGVQALDVGFQIRGKSSTTLASLGRGVEADIYVEGSSIAKAQCSFEIDSDTGVIMFFDRSHGCTTQVSGENAMQFEHERIRKVLVQKDLNTIIGMDGERRDFVQFELNTLHGGDIHTEVHIHGGIHGGDMHLKGHTHWGTYTRRG